ncbi:glutathione S-transferase family protein [Vibrio algivorus]|uniref:Glutathione S-transferase n=1 Tax=Vibrio algivorus TaxID=1667024 RepID=A0A557NUC1_9VIBR|nr:glutathione S-transferase family protein [Vibrio algivorus]TVO32028.1 glutathione S-transferase family protein [Vibrio algivorus]GLT13617.1 glutathione S-transferase [Vibrio algivorus]
MQIYIGNQNYSSWSLRGWLIFAQYNLEVEVIKLPLFKPEFYQTLKAITPTTKVPTLVDSNITVWDSLAILEYINECYLNGQAWPNDPSHRAKARALACEMHSGFTALRNEMPMNCRATRRIKLSETARHEIERIDQMWSQQMSEFPEEWLFGEWSITDAMYAPIALRFQTYQISLSDLASQYQKKVINSPAIQRWLNEASLETDIVQEDEAGDEV